MIDNTASTVFGRHVAAGRTPATSPSGKPLLVDFCCCAGGAAMGYHRAGFEIVGVDIAPQPNFPFHFIQGDMVKLLADQGFMSQFAAVHASPPCQRHSRLNYYNRKEYPNLVPPTQELLYRMDLPWVIENVPQAPLRNPVTLCGAMFGLNLYRHRAFETNVPLLIPPHPRHVDRCARNGYLPTPERPNMSIHGGKHSEAWRVKAAEAMGVPWTKTIVEVCESIPPTYTQFVGEALMSAVRQGGDAWASSTS